MVSETEAVDDTEEREEEEEEFDDNIDGVFEERNESCPISPHLREDIKRALPLYAECEDELGTPAVLIEDSKTSFKYFTAVRLTFSLADISDHLRQLWSLDDTAGIIMEIDNIHRSEFREYGDPPSVNVWKHGNEGVAFLVGRQLKNLASQVIDDSYKLRLGQLPSNADSFFKELYQRVAERLPQLSEFCVFCGERLLAGGVLPSICDRELCSYQYIELGLFRGLHIPRVSPDVLSLLLFAFGAANVSYRRRDILTPQPPIRDYMKLYREALKQREGKDVEDPNPQDPYYNPVVDSIWNISKDGTVVKRNSACETEIFDSLLRFLSCPKQFLVSLSSFTSFRETWPQTADFIDWLVISNKSYLERVPSSMRVDFLYTPYQYCFISDTPAKQAQFQRLVDENGGKTRFFFHGSPSENWHSIIRSGLKNMSGTKYEMYGAVYGPGIYLSPLLYVSLGYASSILGGSASFDPLNRRGATREGCKAQKCCELESEPNFSCVALVEVVDSPEAYREKCPDIFVSDEQWCSIRMLLLYRAEDMKKYYEDFDGTAVDDAAAAAAAADPADAAAASPSAAAAAAENSDEDDAAAAAAGSVPSAAQILAAIMDPRDVSSMLFGASPTLPAATAAASSQAHSDAGAAAAACLPTASVAVHAFVVFDEPAASSSAAAASAAAAAAGAASTSAAAGSVAAEAAGEDETEKKEGEEHSKELGSSKCKESLKRKLIKTDSGDEDPSEKKAGMDEQPAGAADAAAAASTSAAAGSVAAAAPSVAGGEEDASSGSASPYSKNYKILMEQMDEMNEYLKNSTAQLQAQANSGVALPAPSNTTFASMMNAFNQTMQSLNSLAGIPSANYAARESDVQLPGDLTFITEEQREQIAKVVRMFRNSGLEDRVSLHLNGDITRKDGDNLDNNEDKEGGPSNP